MKKFKLNKSNKFKRLLCGGLAVLMLSSIPIIKGISKKNKADYQEPSISYSTESDDYSNYKNYEEDALEQFNYENEIIDDNTSYVDEEKSYDEKKSYENNNISSNTSNNTNSNINENIIDVQGVIDDINNVLIDFNENDIYSSIERERSAIKNANIKENLNDINSYSWVINGKIDREKLVYKLTSNIKNSGNAIDTDALKIVNVLSDAIIDDNDVIKRKNSNYDFRVAYNIIDNLVVDINPSFSPDMLGSYSIKYKRIDINPKILNDQDLMRRVLRHEVQHLYQDGVSKNENFGIDDDYSTAVQPLRFNFLYERFADSNAMESMGKGISDDYQSEEEKLDKLCISTGKSKSYFDNAITSHDIEKLTSCFEKECRPFATACMHELDISCGYGRNCSDEFRYNSYDAAMLKLYKNACIRYVKEYNTGSISREQFLANINNARSGILGNCNWNYEYTNTRNSLEQAASEIDDICNNFVKSKVR